MPKYFLHVDVIFLLFHPPPLQQKYDGASLTCAWKRSHEESQPQAVNVTTHLSLPFLTLFDHLL